MTAKRARQQHHRVVGAFVKIPAPLEPGKVRCLGCGAVVALTRNRKIRAHNSPAGEPCAYRASYKRVDLAEVPDVEFPAARRGGGRNSQPRGPKEPSRLDAGSHCRECGRWLPGERSLCGTCYATREYVPRGSSRKGKP